MTVKCKWKQLEEVDRHGSLSKQLAFQERQKMARKSNQRYIIENFFSKKVHGQIGKTDTDCQQWNVLLSINKRDAKQEKITLKWGGWGI